MSQCLQWFGRQQNTRARVECSTGQVNVGKGLSIFVIRVFFPLTIFSNITQQKLQKLTFNLKNSPTILLPMWYKTLAAHQLSPCIMPQDISTHWNSTFNMLDFAIQYRAAINTMTTVCNFGLYQYELAPVEWKIARQLRDVLKVSMFLLL